jgi:hypothetical protein
VRTDGREERPAAGCGERDEVAGGRVGRGDADWEGVVPARAAALVAGMAALIAGADPDVPATVPQAARARAAVQASTRTAAGRASRMGRDVSKSRVPYWHL